MVAFHLQFIWDPTSSLVNPCLHTQGRKAEGARVRKRECWQETNKEKPIFTMSIWQSTCCVATTVHTDPHVTSSGIKLRWAKHGIILQNHSQNKAQVFVIFFSFGLVIIIETSVHELLLVLHDYPTHSQSSRNSWVRLIKPCFHLFRSYLIAFNNVL